jgi:hypothetical protein
MVWRDGERAAVHAAGYDWTDRYPRIVQAARRLRVLRFLIDGKVVVCGEDGISTPAAPMPLSPQAPSGAAGPAPATSYAGASFLSAFRPLQHLDALLDR